MRETSDPALLASDRSSWSLASDACRPLDGARVTYYSVAADCSAGSEGLH